MGRVVGHLLRQGYASVSLLVMFGEVGKAMKLVENGYHIAGAILKPVDVDGVRVRKVVLFRVFDDDEATCLCGSTCKLEFLP
jgi:hypothetical protein